MATWSELHARVVADSPLADSPIHGVDHWARVAENGLSLILAGAPGDAMVVMLFALLHDSQRRDENEDLGHPARAADYTRELYLAGMIGIRLEQMDVLRNAILGHQRIGRRYPSTLGVCLDADRLDLTRVGILPDARYLSTKQAVEIASKMSLDIPDDRCII